MEALMKTEWLDVINKKRNGSYLEWTKDPIVLTEDTKEKLFDIVDTKEADGLVVRPAHTGTATYFNGDDSKVYELRFVKNEEFFNQFREYDESGKITKDWAKGLSRPDYIVYDKSDDKGYFIIHELSEGNIINKKPKAMNQLMNMVKFIDNLPNSKAFCNSFSNRLCYVSASGCVASSPFDMAKGFMDAYSNLPDPIPLPNSSIEKRGFKAYQSNVVKL